GAFRIFDCEITLLAAFVGEVVCEVGVMHDTMRLTQASNPSSDVREIEASFAESNCRWTQKTKVERVRSQPRLKARQDIRLELVQVAQVVFQRIRDFLV